MPTSGSSHAIPDSVFVVVARLLVGDVGDLAEDAEPVGEPDRDEQLAMALVVELVSLPLPVRGRVAPQIHGHVPHPPAQAADELA